VFDWGIPQLLKKYSPEARSTYMKSFKLYFEIEVIPLIPP